MGFRLRIVKLAGATRAGIFVLACGRVEPGAGDTPGCVPGAQVLCECARGRTGVQICADDGTEFLECRCSTDVGSGTSGSAGASSGGSGSSSSGSSGGPNSGTGHGGSSGGTGPDGLSCMPPCAPDAACVNGACVQTGECPGDLARCGAECVSLASSTRHCGSCDAACSTGESCVDGVCEMACAPQTTLCSGECRPLATDYENCGACGAECQGREACLGGACDCRDGWLRCPEDCVDPMTDDENCGACGVVCPASESCIEARCRAASVGWPTLGFDAQRRGVNAAENGVPAALAWASSVTNAELNPVAVERGRVIVTAHTRLEDTGPVWVLSAETGEALWSHDFGQVDVGQPSVVDGRIYVQHAPGVDRPENAMLHCLDAVSGDVLWSSVISAQWQHYWAPAVGESVVYVNGGRYGGLYGFEKDTGRERFFYDDLEQYDEWAPTLVDDGVLSMTEGNLRFHDPETGAVDWTQSIEWDWHGWSMFTVVPELDGTAYVVAPPTLYAVSLRTRATLWEATGGYRSFPAVIADRVFVAGDGVLVALDRATGDVVWTFTVGGRIAYPPVATSRHVYVSSEDTLYAVDIATGTSAWQHTLGGWLSIANGMLFVASEDGTLTAFTLAE